MDKLRAEVVSLFHPRTEDSVHVGAFVTHDSKDTLHSIARHYGAKSFSFGPVRNAGNAFYGRAAFGDSKSAQAYLELLREKFGLGEAADIVSVEPARHHVAVVHDQAVFGEDNSKRIRVAMTAGGFGAISTAFKTGTDGRTYGLSVFEQEGAAQSLFTCMARIEGVQAFQF